MPKRNAHEMDPGPETTDTTIVAQHNGKETCNQPGETTDTTIVAQHNGKEKCNQPGETKVSPVSDKNPEVLHATLTQQEQADMNLLAGLEKYPSLCTFISAETNVRLADLIAARPVESRGLCVGGCGNDVLVTQYREKCEGGYYHKECEALYEAAMEKKTP